MPKESVRPNWLDRAPPQDSYRAIFKWGAPDRFYHPKPGLLAFIQARLGLYPDQWRTCRQIGQAAVRENKAPALAPAHVAHLTAIVGPENARQDAFARTRYAHGQSAEDILRLRQEAPATTSDLVLHPRHREDVCAIVAYCHAQRIPLTVFGGGSSVTLGVKPARGGVTLAMATHMHRVLAFNETNQTITVQPGIFGPAYEDYLQYAPERCGARQRYTGGHFPQSFEYSTVGGWIAALGSGQQSSYYGDACDLVVSQEVVTPVGTFTTADFAATATGPKVNDIMKGSEGAFGVLTAVTLKIFRADLGRPKCFAYMLPGWDQAVEAARRISQGEFGLPSMLRISDPEETEAAVQTYGLAGPLAQRILRWRRLHPHQRCLLIGQADGQKHFAANVARQSGRICRRLGGLWLSGYPARKWAHGRFLDPYMRDDLYDMGLLIDTLETAVPWDRLMAVHAGVRAYITARPQTLCLTHASHFYPQGTNLYFIFIAPIMPVDDYRAFQSGIIEKILDTGGSLSHHHGAGKLMGPWMERHLGPEQMAVLRALKRHFDPHGIMNPGGTLGLDSPTASTD
ncbi:MAG: FAD-binding oxidoreductase [Desulfobacterales bacterium]|nr:FAD-binding oxidoreductase [Desulfobacterales bacterium]